MTFDFEKFVPREKAIIFDDRVEAASPTVFQIVREFFDMQFLIDEIEFGENLCWGGFRPAQVGDEERGWIRIESRLGAKTPGIPGYHYFDIPRIDVGSISIRSLSPLASHIMIRTNYTPEAISFLFNGLAKYLVWVVNGEDAREAWSRAVSYNHIKQVPQIDVSEVPLLEAPSTATEQTAQSDLTPTRQTKAQKPKRKAKRKKTRKRTRASKTSASKSAKQKIYVPSNDFYFDRYRKMWAIIKKTRWAYSHPANDDIDKRPNPTIDELRDAIADELGLKPGERTVRRVIRAGSKRLLKKQ